MNVESIIQPVRDRAAEIEDELLRLRQQFIDAEVPLREELRTLKRILKAADPSPAPSSKAKSNGGRSAKAKAATYPSGAKTVAVANAIMDAIMERPVGEEFRPIDIREALDIDISSATTTPAFEAFRQDGVIRFVRQFGVNKFFARTGDDPSPAMAARLSGDDD